MVLSKIPEVSDSVKAAFDELDTKAGVMRNEAIMLQIKRVFESQRYIQRPLLCFKIFERLSLQKEYLIPLEF